MPGTWSSGGNLTVANRALAGAGSQAAGLCMGGYTSANSAVTEEYDGAAWSSGGNLAVARDNLAGAGSQTAGLCMGGYAGGISAVTEEYDEETTSSRAAVTIYLAGDEAQAFNNARISGNGRAFDTDTLKNIILRAK